MKIKFESYRSRVTYRNFTVPLSTTVNIYVLVEEKIANELWSNIEENVSEFIENKIKEKYDIS